MFETVVIATDGSESAERAVEVALDIADRFDADVHALCVVDERELSGAPKPSVTTSNGRSKRSPTSR